MGMPSAGGAPVDLHRLGKLNERLVVTPNVDSLLRTGMEERDEKPLPLR